MIRSLNIWWAAWALLALVVVLPHGAAAQDAKRVAILDFKGPSAAAVQAQVTAGLKPHVELVSQREVSNTADRLGTSLHRSAGYREVGEALGLSAYVAGAVKKKGHRLEATVRVIDASTGKAVHEEEWSRRANGIKTIKPTVWSALGPAIEDTSGPAKKATKPSKKAPPPPPPPVEEEEEEPTADEEEEERAERQRARERQREEEEEEQAEQHEDEEKATRKKKELPGNKSASHPALVASFGPRIMWRSLSYEGSPSSTNFQTYSSSDEGTPSFNLGLGAQWYPGAHARSDWVSDLGLDFDLDYAVGLKAKVAESQRKVNVTAYELGIGAIYRLPFESFEPRLRIGYVKHVFDVDLPTMPGLDYNSVRFNLGTAIKLVDWLSFDFNFGYLVVLSVGELSNPQYGEDVQTKAWEAGAGALLKFTPEWGTRLSIDYRRYSYDFGISDSTSTMLPLSGTDGYLRLTLAVVYSMPGEKK